MQQDIYEATIGDLPGRGFPAVGLIYLILIQKQ
jgi:hypothetical protein